MHFDTANNDKRVMQIDYKNQIPEEFQNQIKNANIHSEVLWTNLKDKIFETEKPILNGLKRHVIITQVPTEFLTKLDLVETHLDIFEEKNFHQFNQFEMKNIRLLIKKAKQILPGQKILGNEVYYIKTLIKKLKKNNLSTQGLDELLLQIKFQEDQRKFNKASTKINYEDSDKSSEGSFADSVVYSPEQMSSARRRGPAMSLIELPKALMDIIPDYEEDNTSNLSASRSIKMQNRGSISRRQRDGRVSLRKTQKNQVPYM